MVGTIVLEDELAVAPVGDDTCRAAQSSRRWHRRGPHEYVSDPSQHAKVAAAKRGGQITNVAVQLVRFFDDEPKLFLQFLNALFRFFPSSGHGLPPYAGIQGRDLECCGT